MNKVEIWPYQIEVRQMLIIDETAVDLLTKDEVREIQDLDLSFGPRPPESKDIFFVRSVERRSPDAEETSYEAMTKKGVKKAFFTREMVEDLKRKGMSVVEDIKSEIQNMEAGWRNSIYYR